MEGPRYKFSSVRQKYALIGRLLRRFSKDRAPLLWLDDLQHHPDGIGVLEYLLNLPAEDRPAGLIIGTLRADILAENQSLTQRLQVLVEEEICQRIELDAIDPSDHRELIELMLPLAPELADTLAERTEGNPLFAHQLLSHWIGADGIAISDEGFRVVQDHSLSLPDDIHGLWMERLERVFSRYPDQQAQSMEVLIELAAALGREVDQGEWHDLVAGAGRQMPPGFDDELIERGLAYRTEDGWAFAHGLLVDSIERRSRQGGRWCQHHRQCAEMLQKRYREQPRQSAWRRAGHWIEAQQWEQALDPLLEATMRWYELGEMRQFQQSLALHRQILDRLGLDRMAPQRLENEQLAVKTLFYERKFNEGIDRLKGVLRGCRKLGDDRLALRAHEVLAGFYIAIGRFERAQQELQLALEFAADLGDEYWQGKVLYRQVEALLELGALSKAAQYNRRARVHFRNSESVYEMLQCEMQRGWLQLARDQHERGRKTLERALSQATQRGFRYLESQSLPGLGDIARFSGEFDEARRFYEQSHRLNLELGDVHGEAISLFNLAQVELAQGHFERGRDYFERGQARVRPDAADKYASFYDCVNLVLNCGRRDWEQVRSILEKYGDGWPKSRSAWKDHAGLLEIAAGYSEDAGQPDCAHPLWKLAAEVWTKLGNDEAAERAGYRMQSL